MYIKIRMILPVNNFEYYKATQFEIHLFAISISS